MTLSVVFSPLDLASRGPTTLPCRWHFLRTQAISFFPLTQLAQESLPSLFCHLIPNALDYALISGSFGKQDGKHS